MCTLTVLPIGATGYRVVMNRDERRSREPAVAPARFETAAGVGVAPRDGDAGGSWIVADERRRTWCVLNGDATAAGWHESADLRSRGALPFELLGAADALAVEATLRRRLADGELRFRPFQLVLVEHADAITRWQFDGATLRSERMGAPWIATSNGFDPEQVARERRRQFEAWLALGGDRRSLAEQLELHRTHVGAPNDGELASFCLHRPQIATVSMTAVEATAVGVMMRHESGAACLRAPASEVVLPCN